MFALRAVVLITTFITAGQCAAIQSLDELLTRLEQIRSDAGVAAFGFAFVEAQQIEFAGARGIADLSSNTPVSNNTRFRIGSITKAFSGLAMALAEHHGLLKLNSRFSDLAGPGLIHNPFAHEAPVTLAMLLEHTAGLSDLTHAEMYHNDPSPLPLKDAVHTYAENRIVKWRPGEHYSYSNAGAGLAAYAFERASKRDFEGWISQHIFAPLQMTATSWRLDPATRKHLATGYDSDRQTPIVYWHMLFRPFGAINSTPADMARFVRMMLNRGSPGVAIPQAVFERVETPTSGLAARAGLDFGYGLGVYSWLVHGQRFFGHGGDGDGYLAHFGYCRSANRAYFIVINAFKHAPLRNMREAIEAFIVRDQIKPAAPPAGITDARIKGRYIAATSRFGRAQDESPNTLEVFAQDGQWYTRQAGAKPQALLAVTPGQYRRQHDSVATIAIVPDARGRLTFHGERQSFVQTRSGP